MKESEISLPDTNIFVHYIRDDEVKERVEAEFGLLSAKVKPFCSQIVEAEILSLAMLFGWGKGKRGELQSLFDRCQRISIDLPGMNEAYVAIDNYNIQIGRKMGKNDIWIAATACITGATLLTTDHDFDHLDSVFLRRVWIEPHHLIDY